MSIRRKIERALRGDIKPKTVILEAILRTRQTSRSGQERANLDQLNAESPKLILPKSLEELLSHFQHRGEPHFLAGFASNSTPKLQSDLFPGETNNLLADARKIVDEHSWPLLGFGVKSFGKEFEWRRDPLSKHLWSLDYHRDIRLIRNDGSDARVLWELNRLGHFVTLARAYAVSGDERFSEECFSQLGSWAIQNPYGRGVNWNCAMEVALRAMNLLSAFELLRRSTKFDMDVLSLFLRLFHQHGTYIRNNLEFSYIATSNHYLSDLAGLLWLGLMLPEFSTATNWREFALKEMLAEMDKQILPDGADFESSTGYHRYILELFLYSFILCKQNDVEIEEKYWSKLKSMLEYVREYLRPDGLAPLIGDSDSGQILPICRRGADEHAYALVIGAALFGDPGLKPRGMSLPEELLWILGEKGVEKFRQLEANAPEESASFPDAGTYIMRHQDLYLCFNTSDAGVNGRGSHGHNDALSIEVCVGDRPFIVDPGTYVYTADLAQRQLFRSTAYHSTVRIDGEEQNTTIETVPFVIGNETKPRVLEWKTSSQSDRVVAEHYGYKRLPSAVVHRRTIVFDKVQKLWVVEDEFLGEGEHEYEIRFHFAPGLSVEASETFVTARVDNVGMKITSIDVATSPSLENQATSRDYGENSDSVSACWRVSGRLGKLRWEIENVRYALACR